MSERAVPSTSQAVWTLAAVTLKRLGRGKALWIGGLLAALPVLSASVLHARRFAASPDDLFKPTTLLLVLLPAMFIGASLGEEIEDRSSTYLWSRPIARGAVLAGKLCALTPIVIALVVAAWVAASEIGLDAAPALGSCVALAAGGAAASLVAAGIATIVPKHGMALTIGYMLVDLFISELPFSLNQLSIMHQTYALASVSAGASAIVAPIIAMIVVAGVWAAVGFWRIRRLEV